MILNYRDFEPDPTARGYANQIRLGTAVLRRSAGKKNDFTLFHHPGTLGYTLKNLRTSHYTLKFRLRSTPLFTWSATPPTYQWERTDTPMNSPMHGFLRVRRWRGLLKSLRRGWHWRLHQLREIGAAECRSKLTAGTFTTFHRNRPRPSTWRSRPVEQLRKLKLHGCIDETKRRKASRSL